MTAQILLICSFFVTGALLQLILKKRAPLWFLLPTAYLWGALNWALLTLLSLLLIQHFNFGQVLLFNGIEVLATLVFILRSRHPLPAKHVWVSILVYMGYFLGAVILFSLLNITRISPDSLNLIKMAEQIADSGFKQLTWTSPAAYGYFISLVQVAANSLGLEYMYLFQPVLSVNFIALVFLAIQHFLSGQLPRWRRILFGLLAVVFLFSPTMMRFQFGYIHTNLPSAAFLFSSLVALLLLARGGEDYWLVYAMVGFAGFGITRTENPLLLLLFLGLFLPFIGTTYKQRVGVILPALAVVLVCLGVTLGIDTSSVNPELSRQLPTVIIAGMAVVCVLFIGFLLVSRLRWIEEVLLPGFHRLLFLAVVAAFLLALLLNPSNLLASMGAIFSATMLTGGWDAAWLTALALLGFVLLYHVKNVMKPPAVILGMGLLLYYLAMLLMSLYRAPYHAQWNDSANRMFTQLMPLFLLFITLLLEQVSSDPNKQAPAGAKTGLPEDELTARS